MGINTAIYSRSGGSMGIGFAIPVSTAQMVLELVRVGGVAAGSTSSPKLSPELAENLRREGPRGVIITGVLQNRPAKRAGIAW